MQNSLTHFFCEMFSRAAAFHSVGRGFCALLIRVRDFGRVWRWLERSRRISAMVIVQLILSSGGSTSVAADFAASFSGFSASNFAQSASTFDATGNVYIAGTFTDASLIVGTVTISKIGAIDTVVTKIDAAGTVVWVKNFGGSGANTQGQSVAVDTSGNVYLSGHFDGANLTTPALTKVGNQDAFAFKLDSAGNSVWAKNFGGSGAGATGGIAVDTSGNIYLGGHFYGANLTTPALVKIGNQDAFAFKLDSAGNSVWAKNFGGSGASATGRVAVDASGNVYLGGYFTGANLTNPALTKIGGNDAFAFKLDSAGSSIWSRNFGGVTNAYGQCIAVDAAGNVYLGGYVASDDVFNPVQDAFARKLDSAGTSIWFRNFGGIGSASEGRSIAVDTSGNVYLGGHFGGGNLTTPALTKIGIRDSFAFKLDSAGNSVWARNFGGIGARATGQSIAVDAAGNVYLGGHFSSGNLTNPALTKIGNPDAFALKLDSAGNTTLAKSVTYLKPDGDISVEATAVDAIGNTYLAGYFNSAIARLGSIALTRIGTNDILVAKLNPIGTVLWAKNFGGSEANAQGRSIAVDAAGNVYLSGEFGHANLTTPAMVKIGSFDVFALKFDSAGTLIWSNNFGGIGASAVGPSIAVDGSGNVYLGGRFQDANLTTPALTLLGSADAYALKLDSAGTTIWSKNFGGSGGAYAFCRSIAVDASGNVYLAGYFQFANLSTPALTKIGIQDAFAFKLDSAGTSIWARHFGGSFASARSNGIAVDASGNVYLGGNFDGANLTTPTHNIIGFQDAFAFKLDSAGTSIWSRSFGGSAAVVEGQGIAVDESGNVYLGGYFYSSNLTTPALTKIGGRDAFTLKLGSTGAGVWARNFGGSGANANGQSIAIDASSNVYLAGNFSVANLTTPALSKIGNTDGFIIKRLAASSVAPIIIYVLDD